MGGMGGMGGGMGGMGGRRNSNVFRIRIIALVVVVLAGVLLGRQGTGYEIVRWCYYGVIIGAITYSFSRRRAARNRMGQQGPGGFSNPGMSGPGPAQGMPAPPPMPGWYPESGSAATQRYWDGATWGARRRWTGSGWISE